MGWSGVGLLCGEQSFPNPHRPTRERSRSEPTSLPIRDCGSRTRPSVGSQDSTGTSESIARCRDRTSCSCQLACWGVRAPHPHPLLVSFWGTRRREESHGSAYFGPPAAIGLVFTRQASSVHRVESVATPPTLRGEPKIGCIADRGRVWAFGVTLPTLAISVEALRVPAFLGLGLGFLQAAGDLRFVGLDPVLDHGLFPLPVATHEFWSLNCRMTSSARKEAIWAQAENSLTDIAE